LIGLCPTCRCGFFVLTGFGPERGRGRARALPVGGGEPKGYAVPFLGRIYFYASQLAHGGQARPFRLASNYPHHRHHGRLSGAVNAVWAVCSSTWSSWTSRRRASSSSAWAWTWACLSSASRLRASSSIVWPWTWDCSAVTSASRLLSCPFNGWSLRSISTSHRYPWGVASWWATSSPLPMRLRTVSELTPRRRAASLIDTFATVCLLSVCCISLGHRFGSCLRVAWADAGWFWPVPLSTKPSGPSPWPLNPRDGKPEASATHRPAGAPAKTRSASPQRADSGPPHLLSGGLNVHGYIC